MTRPYGREGSEGAALRLGSRSRSRSGRLVAQWLVAGEPRRAAVILSDSEGSQ